jgi:nitrite reductase/ring-hydroxylating ferredoxin subunit
MTKAVRIDGMPELVVCNVDGEFHVVDAACSHVKTSLAEGRLLGCEIECPLHSGRFDVRTGRATRRPAKRPIAVYECMIDGDDLYIVDTVRVEDRHFPMDNGSAPTASYAERRPR